MKKLFSGANVQAAVLLILSIAETITMIICAPISVGTIVVLQLVALCGILAIRFAYFFALRRNKWHSFFYRENQENADDEPSKYALVITKIAGYLCLTIQTVVSLVIVMLWTLV